VINYFKRQFLYVGELGAFFVLQLKAFFSFRFLNPFLVRQIIRQFYFTAVMATLFASVLSVFLGAVTIFESLTFSSQFGVSEFVSRILIVIIVRELGPLFIALIIIGRSGTAIATELGNMRVSGEIDLLEREGIDPVECIVLPRVISVSLATFSLSIYFSFVAVLGGIFVSHIVLSISLPELIDDVANALYVHDIIINMAKGLLFGGVISIVSSFNALRIIRSPIYVPQATTKSVVEAIMMCFIINGVIAVLTLDSSMLEL
jgi:phospholipid/cholesterol/gamma-HCH transport system permease protein